MFSGQSVPDHRFVTKATGDEEVASSDLGVSNSLDDGVTPAEVAQRVGDEVATTMEHYAHAVRNQERATASIGRTLYGD